jgi:hypothetical protein
MKYLKVFQEVDIPVDLAVTQKYVALGASDSGKTYMLAKFAEQLADAGAFFVILDPVGKHWSLRAGPDGKARGGKNDVWVLGGLHGDVPLDPNSGELVADTVLDHPGRYVVDVSLFETDAEVHRFADALARRLFRRKMRDPGWPLLLMLEEAESFLPQNVMKGQEKMKNAFGRIVRQGRNHGLGVFLVFQRSAAGDKGAISQCKILIAKRTSHNRDQDAIDDWVRSNGTPDQRTEMMAALASMGVEEAYVWDPAWLKVFKRTRVLKRQTFDSSANVRHGEQMASVELAPLDVGALGQAMKKVAEDAKANDPKELRERLSACRRELDSIARHVGIPEDHWVERSAFSWGTIADATGRLIRQLEEQILRQEPQRVTVPVLQEGELERLEEALSGLENTREQLGLMVTEVAGTAGELGSTVLIAKGLREPTAAERIEGVSEESMEVVRVAARSAARRRTNHDRPNGATAPPPPSVDVADDAYEPTGLARDILETLASVWPRQLTRQQVGAMTGKKADSGYFNNTLSKLRSNGYLSGITPTQRVFDLVGHPEPKTPSQLRDLYREKLGNGLPREIFELLVEHPNGLTRQEIAEMTGKSCSAGYFNNMLSKVRGLGIVETQGNLNRLIDELIGS